ncbi:MAG: hypothetical protein SCALA702_04350 [Melioribacteraceae bacterium]|nr:MAG: hypothetical protein SCALA702_04350 [Melioribacteraceae bacterium]
MKTLRLFSIIILLVIASQSISAQRVGYGLNASFSNETNSGNTGFGYGINAQFLSDSSNLSYRVSLRPFFSQINSEFLKHDLNAISYEISLLYTAIEGTARPYFGVGLGYVSLSLEKNGNAVKGDNRSFSVYSYDNSFVINLFTGASLYRNEMFEPYAELNFRVIPIYYELLQTQGRLSPLVTDEDFTFTEIVLNIGFMLNF